MADKARWLLPEGIEDVLPPEAWRLERLRQDLLSLLYRWGYDLVMPPLVEYLESLLTGMGGDLDLQTFKLTDQLTGRLMGIRADMTPQVARIDAHRLKRDTPARLCYMGSVLHTRPDGFSRSRNPLQIGAELYGHATNESDVEILSLMLQVLAVTGIRQVHVDLGHVGIFRGLAREAQLNPEQEGLLFDALQRKAKPEIEDFLAELRLDKAQRRRLISLADLNGGDEVLVEAQDALKGACAEVTDALANLQGIAEALWPRPPAAPLHFDLAELRGYHYHTGVVFAAFVSGHGQAIAQGGRYDDVGRVFGHARPATGFSVDLKTLVALCPKPADAQTKGVFAPCMGDPALQAMIQSLRDQGQRVVCELPGQKGGAHQMGCDRMLARRKGIWTVVDMKSE